MNSEPTDFKTALRALTDEMRRRDPHGHIPLETLQGYHDGSLDPEEHDRVQEHLSLCADCTRELLDWVDFQAGEPLEEDDRLTPEELEDDWHRLVRSLEGQAAAADAGMAMGAARREPDEETDEGSDSRPSVVAFPVDTDYRAPSRRSLQLIAASLAALSTVLAVLLFLQLQAPEPQVAMSYPAHAPSYRGQEPPVLAWQGPRVPRFYRPPGAVQWVPLLLNDTVRTAATFEVVVHRAGAAGPAEAVTEPEILPQPRGRTPLLLYRVPDELEPGRYFLLVTPRTAEGAEGATLRYQIEMLSEPPEPGSEP